MQGKNQPLAVGPALDKTAFTAQSGKRQVWLICFLMQMDKSDREI